MLDEKTVEHVTRLARLKLSEEEKRRFLKELSTILEAFSEIENVETKDVEPSFQPLELKNVLREDKPEECLPQEEALKNAELREGDFFKGPRIIEHETHAS